MWCTGPSADTVLVFYHMQGEDNASLNLQARAMSACRKLPETALHKHCCRTDIAWRKEKAKWNHHPITSVSPKSMMNKKTQSLHRHWPCHQSCAPSINCPGRYCRGPFHCPTSLANTLPRQHNLSFGCSKVWACDWSWKRSSTRVERQQQCECLSNSLMWRKDTADSKTFIELQFSVLRLTSDDVDSTVQLLKAANRFSFDFMYTDTYKSNSKSYMNS